MESDSQSSPSSPNSLEIADHPRSPDASDAEEDDVASSPVLKPNDDDHESNQNDQSDIEQNTSKEDNNSSSINQDENSKVMSSDNDDVSDLDETVDLNSVSKEADSDDSDDEFVEHEKEIERSEDEKEEEDEEDGDKQEESKEDISEREEVEEGSVNKIAQDKTDQENEANPSDDSDDDDIGPSGSNTKIDKLKEAEEIFGDSESEDEEFEGFKKDQEKAQKYGDESDDDEDIVRPKRKRVMLNSDSEDEDNQTNKKADSDDEEDENKEDEEEKEDEAEESEKDDQHDKVLPEISSSSEDELDDDQHTRKQGDDLVYDFDIMMQKRKEQNARSRKRKNTDIINDSDDIIAELIQQMKQAAEDDFELNKDRKAATRKMKLLPLAMAQLKKIDLREAFLDAGVLSVMTDWLTPLPDRSLPNLQVRESMLKILLEFNIMDVERLKASGIGKAVMYLFKHPKEIKENKKRAGQLISNWSRPIFNCDADYQTISKEDREQRDFDHMNKLSKRMRSEELGHREGEQPSGTLRPGDKGWIPRARVPAPSTKDYVVRPKSSVEMEMSRSSSKKTVSRLEKHLRNFQERRRSQKSNQRAVKISIEGRKL